MQIYRAKIGYNEGYFISLNNETATFYRSEIALASDSPLSKKEEVIAALCEYILSIKEYSDQSEILKEDIEAMEQQEEYGE